MDEIRAQLARLSSLSDEELDALRQRIVDEFKTLDGEATSIANTAVMNELADLSDKVMAEGESRANALAEAEAARETARERVSRLQPSQPEGDADGEGEGEPQDGEQEQPEAGATDEAEDEQPPARRRERNPEPDGGEQEQQPAEAVLADGGGSVARLARRSAPARPSPEQGQPARPAMALMASGALGVSDPTLPISDRRTLAAGMARTLSRMPRNGPPRGTPTILASMDWSDQYPDERKLGSDPELNTERMEAVAGLTAPRIDPASGSLTASGGICLPVNVDYAVPTWATAQRPLRDALPSFQATRGGIRFVQPPSLSAWEGATSIWTEATDANPAGATKPIVVMNCGKEELVYVDAVPTRIGFGNMQSRFAPEQVAANTDLAMAIAARIAENNLLEKIAAACIKEVTHAKVIGATRDFLTVLELASGNYRQAFRIPEDQTLTAILPFWLRHIIKADLANEQAHDVQGRDTLAVTEAEVDALVRAHNINPIWHYDGNVAKPGGVTADQRFAAVKAKTALPAFPPKVVWYFFAEGMFQFLDGGRLDLGVVRDSTLDATNDYETFVETFEGIAYRGFAEGAWQLVTELCANGGSGGTVTGGACP